MKLNERYGKPNAHYMKRLEEITRYAMDDYARILAFRVDLLLPVGNSHKGYDSAVITRFIASLKAQWIRPYISRHLLSLNPLLARCRRYSRGER